MDIFFLNIIVHLYIYIHIFMHMYWLDILCMDMNCMLYIQMHIICSYVHI